MTTDTATRAGTPPATIYDVARTAGVSIASVSRVLNDRGHPRADTRDRVLRAVAELGFVPDGAARALSVRLKEVIGVIVRRPSGATQSGFFAVEDDNLQFADMINRGMEGVAQRRGFDLLVRSVDLYDADAGPQIFALAGKSDGMILHDQVLGPGQLDRLSRQVPVVTLAGVPTPTTANVRGDNAAGMRELARHLIADHGYQTLGYVAGHRDSPDSMARGGAVAQEVAAAGATLLDGPLWQGSYSASGGARIVDRMIAEGLALPRAIVCANDQTAIGVMAALAQHGISVPGQVAVAGFDDIPVARHLHPQLTSVKQSIEDLGVAAFETVYSMIGRTDPGAREPRGRDIVLPTRLIRRESCGCQAEPATAGWQVA